jgi:hypothetical protein
MRRVLVLLLAVGVGVVLGRMFDGVSSTAEAGGGKGGGEAKCASENGDVNADGEVDISDGITILGHLFLGNPTELVSLCATPTGPSGLPDTGQTNCYEEEFGRFSVVDCARASCAGQDGFYATGCSGEGRFVDNGDGTVTDTCTGLMWQKGTGNHGIWCNALAYCEGLELAGHSDWRLPNVRELQSIVDYGRFHPAIDPVFGALSSFYWSSTSFEDFPVHAWVVCFYDGVVDFGSKDVVFHVRAVRSGP